MRSEVSQNRSAKQPKESKHTRVDLVCGLLRALHELPTLSSAGSWSCAFIARTDLGQTLCVNEVISGGEGETSEQTSVSKYTPRFSEHPYTIRNKLRSRRMEFPEVLLTLNFRSGASAITPKRSAQLHKYKQPGRRRI